MYTKSVDQFDHQGQTAAHTAAYHGEKKCLSLLIDKNCDLNVVDYHLCTPAHLAAKQNHSDTLK